MIAAVAAFSFMDALMKMFAAYYPPMQVAVLRGAASLPFTVLPLLLAGRLGELRPRRWRMHLLRGLLTVVVWNQPTALVAVVVVLIALALVGLVGLFSGRRKKSGIGSPGSGSSPGPPGPPEVGSGPAGVLSCQSSQ